MLGTPVLDFYTKHGNNDDKWISLNEELTFISSFS